MNRSLLIRDLSLRLILLVALDQGFGFLLARTSDAPDADIGAGLLALAGIVLVSGVGGLLDGARRPVVHLSVVWVACGLLFGVVSAALLQAGHGPVDVSVLVSDLRDLAPFLAGLVAVPALLGGAVSALATPRSRPVSPAPQHATPSDRLR